MSVFGAVRRTGDENEAKNGCRLYQEDESCFQNKRPGHFSLKYIKSVKGDKIRFNYTCRPLTSRITVVIGGSKNFRRGPDIYGYQRISQRAVRTSLERQLDPRGPIASRGR